MNNPVKFGRYSLIQRVNIGGMAEIFKAKTFGVEGFEKTFAIKRILPSIAQDKDFIIMFVDEAKIMAQLQHSNITQVYELGLTNGSYFIAMEFIDGKDLKQLFRKNQEDKKPMDIAQACYIVSQICSGLDYAHRKKDSKGNSLNIIHRDVSPQNIRISYDGDVKILDFGIAKTKIQRSETQTGTLKGKFGYMTPEQISGKEIDRRSDIFAIGIILYELLTGTRLFKGKTDFSILKKILNVTIELPRKRNPNIPIELEKILMKALTVDREKRYEYASDMYNELQKFMILNNYMYSKIDLSNWMKKTYKKEIEQNFLPEKKYENHENKNLENKNLENPNKNLEKYIDNNPNKILKNVTEKIKYNENPQINPAPNSMFSINEELNKYRKLNVNSISKLNSNLNIKPDIKVNLEKKIKIKKSASNILKKQIIIPLILILGLSFVLINKKILYSEPKITKNIEEIDYKMNININITPKGLFDLYINGKLVGKNIKSPYLIKGLKPGIHEIKIEKDGYLPSYEVIKIPQLTINDTKKLKKLSKKLSIKKYGITYKQFLKKSIEYKTKLEKYSIQFE